MAKKQHIADEDLVTESWPCSVDDRVDASASRLRDGLSGRASLHFQANVRRRESVLLVETQPQKTRQTSNMDTFATAGEAADEERHLHSSLVLNSYHRRSIDAVSVDL